MTDAANTMILTYRYRLLPTKAQHGRLRDALEHSRQLYNAALEERIDCYRKTGKGRSYYQQSKSLTEWRASGASRYSWDMDHAPLKAVAKAYEAFFRRGGFPRFKGFGRFRSFGWVKSDGWRVRDGRFCAKGLGAIRVHMHRPLPNRVKTAQVKREGRHWYLSVACEVECQTSNGNVPIGVDVGLSHLAALSNGELIENVQPYRRAMRDLRLRQRALARCKRGSKRRQKARERLALVHRKIRQSRDTYLHQVSADLTKRFGLIAIEDLNVKGLASGMLAKAVNDASWGKFIGFLRYKAERAGSKIVEVSARGTSQTCPECGQIKAKMLSQRVHFCTCGCVMNRDVAAAKVILHRAVHRPARLNESDCAERALRKAAA